MKKENVENTIKDSEIKKALIQSKIPFQRIGQGIHNNVFYYGTNLIYDNKKVSAIVTSNKKLYLGLNYVDWKCASCDYTEQTIQPSYEKIKPPKNCNCERRSSQNWKIESVLNPIKNEFGLNYRTEFNEDALDNIWQTEDIKKYLGGKYLKKSIREIYEDLLKINKKYIDHLNPTSHKYTICWIIATYIFTLLEQIGRYYTPAEKGSGKTKQARVIKNLIFNPMWITKGTESSIFRDAEATCGSFIVDNMDKLHEDLKRSMEHLIETGWMQDATYRLTNKDTMATEKFLSYTPMAINNIFGLDSNTIDKVFEIPMLKSVNQSIARTKPTSKSENWVYHRNSLRCWALDNWKKVQKVYGEINATFSGREFDVVESVLTIAKLIGEKEYNEIELYVKEKIEEELIDLENNKSYMVFSKIWKKFEGQMIESNIFLKEIADELFPSFYPNLKEDTKDYNDKKRNFSRYIGKIIRSVPMFRKGGLSQGKTYIKIQKKDLEQYMNLQHFIDEKGILLSEKEDNHKEPLPLPTSTTTTNSTTSTNPYPSFSKGESRTEHPKVEQVEQVEQLTEVEQKKILEDFE